MSGRCRDRSRFGDPIFPQALCPRQAGNVISRDGGAMPAGVLPQQRASPPEGKRTLAVQERLPLARQRTRSARRSFTPAQGRGTYRLPHDVRDRLVAALAPFRNREAAFALAVFLARFWSMPGRVALPFPIDRRALAGHRDLELTEGRVRGAIRVLEEIGFLARFVTSGSRYKATEEGLRRKPIPFQFGLDYAPLFIAANARATAARGRQEGARRPLTPDRGIRPS